MTQIETAATLIEVHTEDRPVWLRPELKVEELDHATQTLANPGGDGLTVS